MSLSEEIRIASDPVYNFYPSPFRFKIWADRVADLEQQAARALDELAKLRKENERLQDDLRRMTDAYNLPIDVR